MQTEPAFTETELARRWNVSIKTLQRWRSEERGPPYIKLSKAVRYPVDEIVTYERVYSDSLMAMMLRAHRAEFKDAKDAASMTASGTGGVLIVPGAPATINDWQNQFGDLARGTVGRPTGEGS